MDLFSLIAQEDNQRSNYVKPFSFIQLMILNKEDALIFESMYIIN